MKSEIASWRDRRIGERGRLVLILLAVALALDVSGILRRVDQAVYDLALRWSKREAAHDILIVAIDEKSLKHLGRWPWSRRVHADLLQRLTAFGARAVAFDIAFSEPTLDDPEADERLAGAIAANGKVVLPVFPVRYGTSGSLVELMPLPVFARAAAKLGHADVELDPDSIARSVYMKAGLDSPVWPHLAVAMLETVDPELWQHLPGERPAALEGPRAGTWVRDYRISVAYAGPPGHVRRVSYVDVLRDDDYARRVAGKFVLVGITAAGLGASLPTPMSGHAELMPGVELNANVLDTLRHGHLVEPVPMALYLLFLLGFAIAPALLYPRLSARGGPAAAAGLAVCVPALAVACLAGGRLWFDPAPILFATALSYPLWIWGRLESSGRALATARERGRAALHAIADAVITTDATGRVDYMNPVAEALIGAPNQSAVGADLDTTLGAVDPVERKKVLQVSAQALRENRAVRSADYVTLNSRAGDTHVVRVTASPIRAPDNGQGSAVIAMSDMTEKLSLNRRMTHFSTHDGLTELPNRLLLNDRLTRAIAVAARNHSGLAVVLLDLDGFKRINDSFGHEQGDTLLVQVAERLGADTRSNDTVARWGDDEFALVCEEVQSDTTAAFVARKIIEKFDAPFEVDHHELFVTASLGVSLYPADGGDALTLLKSADAAMQRAKQRGRKSIEFASGRSSHWPAEQLQLERDLHYALKRDELELYYQPQFSVANGAVTGVEALIRWHHPQRGLLLPGVFIPVAEQSNLIDTLGSWVLQQACAQTRNWRDEGLHEFHVAVNVSARQFAHREFAATVRAALRDSGAVPESITLELTESSLMQDTERAAAMMTDLKALGVRISIDDFGTGYSSLTYLKRFPVDQLKIDQTFVRDLSTDPDDAAITEAIIAMARSMGIAVIAEGVETEAQLGFLRTHQCTGAQGYYFSAAVRGADATTLLRRHAGPVTAGVRSAVSDSRELQAPPPASDPTRLH